MHGLLPAFEWIGKRSAAFAVLIIHGTSDEVVKYAYSLTIKENIPHAELLPVEGARHDLLVTAPHNVVVIDAVSKFLQTS